MKLSNQTRKQDSRAGNASEIHVEVIRSYVMHHCEGFSWKDRALGLLRARAWTNLLMLSKEVNEKLLQANTFVECANTENEYGTAASFRAATQFVALISKYPYSSQEVPGLDPDAVAKRKFLAAERRNRRLNIVFAAHTSRGTDRHWVIPLVRKELHACLGDGPFYERIFEKCDFSGGASTQHHGKATHLAAKLMSDQIQGRVEALNYFKLALWRNEHYRRLFLPCDPVSGITSLDREVFEAVVDRLFKVCDHNNITAVPKNAESSRTIAMESMVLNFLQKGADLEMRALLKAHFHIDLTYQEPNQLLAFNGSVNPQGEDGYVTIDEKDASNSVIREFCRAVLPRKWYRFLDHIRSPYYILDGVVQPYEMFCSMGNGFCFPLETMIFAAICKSVARHYKQRPDFRCYGDDIVVRQSLALVTIEALNACGFRTNVQKTYITGPFRESCGANWYDGQDMTPGYYKEPITTVQQLHALHNSLPWPAVKQTIWGLAGKYFTRGYFVEDIPQYAWISNQAFKVPLDVAMANGKSRWSRDLHKWDFVIKGTIPIPDEDWASDVASHHRDDLVVTAALRGAAPEEPFHLRRATRSFTSWTCDLSESTIEAFRRGADSGRKLTRQLGVLESVISRLEYGFLQSYWPRRLTAAQF